MSSIIQSYKGVRDFYPDDYTFLRYLFKVWIQVCESYGYQRYDASALEYLELYRLKNQSNLEIIKDQIYTFTDRGQREVALRPEMTPTIARMIADKYQQLIFPIRWYSIPNVFRYERPQRGRLREHWQLNVDLFGINSNQAELEIILMVKDILSSFGADDSMYTIRLGSRQVLEILLGHYCQLNDKQIQQLILLLDKYDKINIRNFKIECEKIIGFNDTKIVFSRIQKIITLTNFDNLPTAFKTIKEIKQFQELLLSLRQVQVNNILLDLKIVRGFDYYTGVVFEVFDTHKDNNRSLFGGGRYDNLLESFSNKSISGVGFGMGDVTLADFIKTHHLTPNFKTSFDLYLALMPEVKYNQIVNILKSLRKEGLKVFVDNRKLNVRKKIESALKRKTQYILFIGQEDLVSQQFNLKHLPTSQEEKLNLSRIITKLVSIKSD